MNKELERLKTMLPQFEDGSPAREDILRKILNMEKNEPLVEVIPLEVIEEMDVTIDKEETIEEEQVNLVKEIQDLDKETETLQMTVNRLNKINAESYMNKLKNNLIELVVLNPDINSIKQQMAWNLGLGNETPEMEQLHQFMAENSNYHLKVDMTLATLQQAIDLIREENKTAKEAQQLKLDRMQRLIWIMAGGLFLVASEVTSLAGNFLFEIGKGLFGL